MIDSLERMRRAVPWRQVTLFVLAVVVPSVVLVMMAAWMAMQEGELTHKRARDERQRQIEEIRQGLVASLERVKLLQAAAYRESGHRGALQPHVVLVARVERDRLVLPWDEPARAAGTDDAAVSEAIQRGERAELVEQDPAAAAAHYGHAVTAARSPHDAGYARLLLARAWSKARPDRARAAYQAVFELAPAVVDEHGVPLWAYAAQRLVAGADPDQTQAIVAKIGRTIDEIPLAAPVARFLLRDLLDAVRPEPILRTRLDAWIAAGEQAAALQAAFPLDPLRDVTSDAPKWALFGEPPWLVSVAGGAVPLAVAVPAQAAIDGLALQRVTQVRLLHGDATVGDWIGDGLSNMKVSFNEVPGGDWSGVWRLQRWVGWLIVALSLTVTGVGAHLLWRDVRREVRTAELRSQFVSSVSHELKTPLSAIRMFAETLRMRRGVDDQTAVEYLDTIVNESERLTRLLNNVLEFSKIERGATHFRLVRMPPHEPIARAIRAMHYPLEQQGFRLSVELPEQLPPVRIDADAIEQALLNLLANAMKYSGKARDISFSAGVTDQGVEMSVTDLGIGIDPADHARVFEKFYRAATPHNRHIAGTGLGLTLVDHIVRAHDGCVRLTSAPGLGSTFTIVLPVAPPDAPGAASMTPATAV